MNDNDDAGTIVVVDAVMRSIIELAATLWQAPSGPRCVGRLMPPPVPEFLPQLRTGSGRVPGGKLGYRSAP